MLLEKTTLGTVNTGVNKVETINARDAVFVAVCSFTNRLSFPYRSICILVLKISCCTRFITINSPVFRCIEGKLLIPGSTSNNTNQLTDTCRSLKYFYTKKLAHCRRILFFVIHLTNVFEHRVDQQVSIVHHYH